jgi:hypothetical protein
MSRERFIGPVRRGAWYGVEATSHAIAWLNGAGPKSAPPPAIVQAGPHGQIAGSSDAGPGSCSPVAACAQITPSANEADICCPRSKVKLRMRPR